MKLKTLKDMEECKYMLSGVCEHCLKAEAVKWVKDLEETGFENEIIKWIEHFFNLTEEDLKNGEN